MGRRVIYMDDKTWDQLRLLAAKEGRTISAVIRDRVAEKIRPVDPVVAPPTTRQPVVVHATPEGSYEDRYDVRPIRPVPKKTK